MPSQQYQYELLFNSNFYQNHYIEIEKLAKSYGLQGNISGFRFSDSHDPIIIQSFFDRIFNDTGSISNLPHQLTWIIKLYNFIHQFNQSKNKIELQIASNHPTKGIFTWRNNNNNPNKNKNIYDIRIHNKDNYISQKGVKLIMPVSTKQYQLIFNPELYNKHYIELDKLIAPLIGQFEDLGLHSYHIKNTWKLSGPIEQDQLDKLVSQQVEESLVNYHQKILSKYSLNLTNNYWNITNKWHKDWNNVYQKNQQSKNSIQHLFKFIYFNNHFTTDGHDSYLYKLINEQNQIIMQVRWPRDLNNKGYANKAIKKEVKHYLKSLTRINNLFKSLNNNRQSFQSLISSLNQTSRLINKAFQTQANANRHAFSSIANQKQQIAQSTHIMHVAHKLEVELPFCTKSNIHMSRKHLLPFKRYQKKLFNKEIQKILGSDNPIETLRNKFGIQLVLVTSQKDELLIIDLIEDGETATDDHLQEAWLKTFIMTQAYQSFLNQKSIKAKIPIVDLCDSKADPDGNSTMHKLIDDMIMLSATNRIQQTSTEYQFSLVETYWAIVNNNKQILRKPIESKRLKTTKSFFK